MMAVYRFIFFFDCFHISWFRISVCLDKEPSFHSAPKSATQIRPPTVAGDYLETPILPRRPSFSALQFDVPSYVRPSPEAVSA